jgi:hypothetical protein
MMSNGEQTYKALKASVLKTLIASFDPDWEELAEDAYKGFIKDVHDDTWLGLEIPDYKGPDSEILIQAFLADNGEFSSLGASFSLSDMLFDTITTYGKENALRAVNNTLTAFYAKLEEKVL